jgi:16S rRNA A1518/A1519 N6-dimethyltransferase RsmA/KsgA/DIM1 with predicted DNA glycosylase/AP lyase activity
MIRKIVDAIPASGQDKVIEIGPGAAGALTELLAERFQNLSVIEIDGRMADYLKETFPGLDIIQKDVLRLTGVMLASGGQAGTCGWKSALLHHQSDFVFAS